ncbi:unnamed protein product [Mytilus coruscus]|uniref:Uncharacterized protein n=1 Tax=Mytilus coruscus TaxID=42192 RepID=A0A6J8EVG8_MYTCO|nr:unnamed protein product [Mytilus coruscus]
MENYLFTLLLSVFVLVVAFYVEQRIIQIKDELLQHGNEIKKVEEERELMRKILNQQVQVELESMSKELYQVKVELESTRKELKHVTMVAWEYKQRIIQIKDELLQHGNEIKKVEEERELMRKILNQQVQVELESMSKELYQVKVELESTRKELKHVTMVAWEYVSKTEQYVRREEIDQIIADVNALREELNETKKGNYRRQPAVKRVVRIIMAISYLPIAVVRKNFCLLKTSQRTIRLCRRYAGLRDFLEYSERNCLNGLFPPQMWNVNERDRNNRTNNNVERASKEDHDWQSQLLEKGEKEKELGNVNIKLRGNFKNI